MLERLADRAATSGTPWARGTFARACAIAATGNEAEEHFTVALDELSNCSMVTDGARTQLLYGEWLRRARGKREARSAFDEALEVFETLGATRLCHPGPRRAGGYRRAPSSALGTA